MHRKKSQAVGWGRHNLKHNAKEKMLEANLKDGMIGQTKNQTWEVGLAHDLNQV
jgi:hypothetical protein